MRVCINCSTSFAGGNWTCPSCGFTPPAAEGILRFAPALEASNSGFEAEYFSPLAQKEPGHFWFEARNDLLLWALRKYAPRASDYLEIGCGTGFVLSGVARALPAMRLCASEIFTAGLRVARQRVPTAEFLQLDARKLPFRDEFDVIGAFDVVEHIDEDEEVLASVHAALRPAGVVMLTVPQHPWLWSAADDYARHKRRYTRPELVSKLEAAGFECLRVTSFISVLLPLMWASRSREQGSAADYDPSREFAIHPAINAGLRAALRLEAGLIRAGLSLPAGGSLLAVARKA